MNWWDIKGPGDLNGLSLDQIEEAIAQAEKVVERTVPLDAPERKYLDEISKTGRVVMDLRREIEEKNPSPEKKKELINLLQETLDHGFKVLSQCKKYYLQTGQGEDYQQFINFLDQTGYVDDSVEVDLEDESDPWGKQWEPSWN